MNHYILYQRAQIRQDELLRQAANHRRARQAASPVGGSSTLTHRKALRLTGPCRSVHPAVRAGLGK
jgi:hypothetical protein